MKQNEMRMVDVLIASPGDAAAGREVVDQAIQHWNDHRSDRESIFFRVRRWETGSVPVIGRGDAQSVINSQLVDQSSIVFALFYHKLGSATQRAISGTAEEIDRSAAAGKLVHVYFYGGPRPNDVDPKELKALNKFRKALFNQGLIGSFANEEQLSKYVGAALEHDIRELTREDGDSATGPPRVPNGSSALDGTPIKAHTSELEARTAVQVEADHSQRSRRAVLLSFLVFGFVVLPIALYVTKPSSGTATSQTQVSSAATNSTRATTSSNTTTAFHEPGTVRHSGGLTLTARGADLDSPPDDPTWTTVSADSKDDIQYIDGYVKTMGSAVLSVPDTFVVSYADCRDSVYGQRQIANLDSYSLYDYVCVRTNEGRYSALKVTGTPSSVSDPEFDVTTWES